MGILIKAARDRDLYVEWSNIADGPGWIGTRAEALADMQEKWDREHPHCIPKPGHAPEDQMQRCDETGTVLPDRRGEYWPKGSTRVWGYPPDGHWDDTGFVYDQRGWLPRGRLAEVLDWIIEHGTSDIPSNMLDPFDDPADYVDGKPRPVRPARWEQGQ